ncbi:MAG: cupin domain-containing protein [Pseudomonadota bacterium]|nr:cupin domain-containing protein [Pseudomonadota bacterium]MEE3320226.1 cupin domain-containing protein [Pseudomonadota bacterium]
MTASLPRFQLPLPADDFLRKHWQKTPLFMPGAATGLDNPDADTLAGLALEEGVEARIIQGAGNGPWQLQQGPLEESVFDRLGEENWTLLVQSVDHFLTDTSLLLDSFSFLPNWRLEDIMMSYAAKGGSVGPHFDRYDVFLIQAAGTRRWQIGDVCDDSSPRQPHPDLKLLADMSVREEFVARPGDVLYLPPGVAHHGVAEDSDCLTWSVGFRAPDYQMLMAEIAGECLAEADSELFSDPDRVATDNPAVLADADRQQLVRGALDLLRPEAIENAVYRWLSTPRQDGLEFAVDDHHIRSRDAQIKLVRHGSTRLLMQGKRVWLNGEAHSLTDKQRPLVHLLASQRRYTHNELEAVMTEAAQELLHEWIEQGYFAPL